MNKIRELFQELVIDYVESDMITLTVDKLNLRKVLKTLRETKELQFNQLIDLCAVDLIEYGKSEWETKGTTSTGYNRGINTQ